MPNTALVLGWIEWILAISLVLVVLIFSVHHVRAFWLICSKMGLKDRTDPYNRKGSRRQ